VFAKFVPGSPGDTPDAFTDRLRNSLGIGDNGALAVYFLDVGKWSLSLGKTIAGKFAEAHEVIIPCRFTGVHPRRDNDRRRHHWPPGHDGDSGISAGDDQASQDKAVLNNARQLSAAADQYFLESGISTAGLTDLIGPTQYIKALNTVASEVYPTNYTQATTITVSGVGGTRTITYHM
jgi:hypothetical protein